MLLRQPVRVGNNMESLWKRFYRTLSLGKAAHEIKKIDVPLEELAPLWLRFNQPSMTLEPATPAVSLVREDATVQDEKAAQKPAPGPSVPPQSAEEFQSVTMQFYRETIEPNRTILQRHGVLAEVNQMVQLLDREGGCPSVVNQHGTKDTEKNELPTLWNVLAQVPLRDHSFRVTKIALGLLNSVYRESENYIPKTIIATLGHDLGKIPSMRGETYSKHDHPIVSEKIVADIFKEKTDVFWLRDALRAIREHHNRTDDQFIQLLRDADGKAREMEVKQFNKELGPAPWDEWFNVEELLGLIRKQINVSQRGDLRCFTHNGVVYCTPDVLYEATQELGKAKKIIDITLHRQTDMETAVRRILNSIRAKDILLPELKPGFLGMSYDVRVGLSNRKMFLVPIKISAFGLPSEVEALGGSSVLIDSVKPRGQAGNQ